MQWQIRPPGSYFQSWLWNSSDFTAYRNLSPLLFSVSEVVLLFKHVSLLPLMYGKLQSALFENWSTGTKIAKGCTCPNCSILKLTSDQFGAGKSLQLKRCVHGFPLTWVGQTLSYWETLSSSPWIIPRTWIISYSKTSAFQFRRNGTDGQWVGSCPLYRLYKDFSWSAGQYFPMNLYTEAFPARDDLCFYTVCRSVQLYRLQRFLLCLVPYTLKHSSSLT